MNQNIHPHDRASESWALTSMKRAWLILPVIAAFIGSPLAKASRFEIKDPVSFPINGENFLAPRECESAINELSYLFFQYGEAAFRNKTKESDKLHQAIQALLGRLSVKESCYPWVYGAEVIYSLNLYNRLSNPRAEALIALVLPLYYSKKLVPLTRELRKEWGGEWAKPKRIMGAYECEATSIFFDPTLRPYDLGAVIAHEVEHLMHDKFSFWDAATIIEEDIPSTLLLDELLSSLHAGYLQLSFQRDMLRKSSGETSPGVIGVEGGGFIFKKRRAFRLGDDLNLFKKGGHLYELWAEQIKGEGLKPGLLFSDFFDIAIYPDFIRDYRNEKSHHWKEILGIVEHAYFDGNGPARARTSHLLESWHRSNPELIVPSGSLLRRAADQTAAGNYGTWELFWKQFNSRLGEISPGCKVLKRAIVTGKSAGYIGSKLGGATPGGEGNRPSGGEGNRPTTPLTPCLFPEDGL